MGLIFKPVLIEKIYEELKNQTRRPEKPGDYATYADGGGILAVYRNGRRQWEVGRDYAIVPGRGKHAVYARLRMDGAWEWQETQPGGNGGQQWRPGRIRITRIRREDVRDISHEDAVAEGFSSKYGFLYTWCDFYDPKMVERIMHDASADPLLPDWCPLFLRSRPDDLYQAWALDFTLMRTGEAKPVVTPPMW